MAALRAHATQEADTRTQLVAAAWNSGVTNIKRLAETAEVGRPTIYRDLQRAGIDYAQRGSGVRIPSMSSGPHPAGWQGVIASFGFGVDGFQDGEGSDPRDAHLVFDTRPYLPVPDHDDPRVVDNATALALVDGLTLAAEQMFIRARTTRWAVRISVGDDTGRGWAPAVAAALGGMLTLRGREVEVRHHHLPSGT